jgi:hypothetical protein
LENLGVAFAYPGFPWGVEATCCIKPSLYGSDGDQGQLGISSTLGLDGDLPEAVCRPVYVGIKGSVPTDGTIKIRGGLKISASLEVRLS